ncbi:MAG: PDZ domain-containing protein [Planctomycetota bacterium]
MNWLLFVLPILLQVGCCSSDWVHDYNSMPVELGRVQDQENGLQIYELKQGDDYDDVTLIVRSEKKIMRADLGLELQEIDKEFAQKKGLTPFRGLYVRRMDDDSAAARAGVMPGDILIKLNDLDMVYMDQFNHVIRNSVLPEADVSLVLLRGFENREEVNIRLTPVWNKVTLPSSRAITLATHNIKGPAYVGFNIGTLPAEWAERIYGEAKSTVLISRVVAGTPGYLAGLRPGDRILSVNGEYFETAARLNEWLQERGPQGETVRFEVFRNHEGSFTTDVSLDDYDNDVRIYFPFVFDFDGDVQETEWEFGPLGMIIDYDGCYLRSHSRNANYRRSLSCILGLYRHDWSPRSSRTRLLWFIDFDSVD